MDPSGTTCGPGAFISHLTAAHLLGLRDRPPSVVELISRKERG
jgi:hypothetical protein